MAARWTPATMTLLALTVLGIAAAVAPLPVALRAALVLPLVLWIPGYAVVRAAVGDSKTRLETGVLSAAVSLAICAPGGIVLHLFDALSPTGWAVYLGTISFVAIFAGSARAGSGAACAAWPWPTAQNAASIALALLLVAAAVHLSRTNTMAHREFAFTELWLVPADAAPDGLTLGIANQESRAAVYDLEVTTDGRLTNRWSDIRIDAGQTWTADLSVVRHAERSKRWRMEAVLFKDGDRQHVYRKVWASSALPSMRGSREVRNTESTATHQEQP